MVLVWLTRGTRCSTSKFAAERAQPFWDLAGLLEDRPIERAVDLGCGTGELTAALAAARDITEMTGVDSSRAMLGVAQEYDGPGVRFREADIGSWSSGGDHDLVFANASLQWVPDHPAVVARWWAALRPGGQLAVQVPTNADHPSHRVAAEVAASEPFRTAMGGPPPADAVSANVLAPRAVRHPPATTSARPASTCGCRSTATCSTARPTSSSGSRARR